MKLLLDTNVLSELLRPLPAPAVLTWFARQPAPDLMVSAVTQAEMLLGVALLPKGKRQQNLQAAVTAMFDEDFAGRVWPFDGASGVGPCNVSIDGIAVNDCPHASADSPPHTAHPRPGSP